jgi:hypothetical protein
MVMMFVGMHGGLAGEVTEEYHGARAWAMSFWWKTRRK